MMDTFVLPRPTRLRCVVVRAEPLRIQAVDGQGPSARLGETLLPEREKDVAGSFCRCSAGPSTEKLPNFDKRWTLAVFYCSTHV